MTASVATTRETSAAARYLYDLFGRAAFTDRVLTEYHRRFWEILGQSGSRTARPVTLDVKDVLTLEEWKNKYVNELLWVLGLIAPAAVDQLRRFEAVEVDPRNRRPARARAARPRR